MGVCSNQEPGDKQAVPLAWEGLPFIGASAFVTVYLALLGFSVAALFFAVVTVCVGLFFRDPQRTIPKEEGVVVSPADGKVVEVRVVPQSDLAPEDMLKVSVFMSLFNAHVNRIPADGTVTDVAYHPGKFFSADLDKASRDNERNAITLETKDKVKLIVVQVAGLIARRIVCRVVPGDRVRRGQRFGLICFGSRLDVYLPAGTRSAVSVGDRVLAGTSVLGYLT